MYRGGGEEEMKRRRERERERESKGQQRRDASIPHFLRKKNYALSFADRGERGEGD
jgi:hypothetical protein